MPKAPEAGRNRYFIDWLADDYYKISDVLYDIEGADEFTFFHLSEGDIIAPDGSVVDSSIESPDGQVVLLDCKASTIGSISFTAQKVDAPAVKPQLPTPQLVFSDGELMIANFENYSEYGDMEYICFIASSDYDFVQDYDALEYQGDGFTLEDYSEGLIDLSEYGYDGSGAYYIRAIDISGYYESSEIAVYDPSGN